MKTLKIGSLVFKKSSFQEPKNQKSQNLHEVFLIYRIKISRVNKPLAQGPGCSHNRGLKLQGKSLKIVFLRTARIQFVKLICKYPHAVLIKFFHIITSRARVGPLQRFKFLCWNTCKQENFVKITFRTTKVPVIEFSRFHEVLEELRNCTITKPKKKFILGRNEKIIKKQHKHSLQNRKYICKQLLV